MTDAGPTRDALNERARCLQILADKAAIAVTTAESFDVLVRAGDAEAAPLRDRWSGAAQALASAARAIAGEDTE